MKFLVGIPCLSGADHCRAAIESVIFKNNTHVLLIDNGAEKSVKNLLSSFFGMRNADIIHNEKNIYVNPAWNQILDFFLNHSNCDYLLIMNSDLIVHKHWDIVLKEFLFRHSDTIPVPVISGDHESVKKDIGLNEFKYTEVFQGTPGVCIVLSREQAKKVVPIPEYLKVWFGDNWIYEILRALNYKTVVLENFIAYHSWSQTVSKVSGIHELIEKDKTEWEERGKADMAIKISNYVSI